MERLIETDQLQAGEPTSVFVDDIPALVMQIDDDYYVVEDMCSHDGQPLSGGNVADGAIACPRHGAKFDVKSGAALCMPATKPIRTFAVEVKEGAVWASAERPVEKPVSIPVASVANVSVPAAATVADTTGGGEAPVTTSDRSSPSSAEDYLEALRQVIDPELMINIVDLGLIYSVEPDEENDRKVNVDMTLTSPACPAGPQLVNQSKMALERLHDVDEAAITIVMSPPWSPERMTDEARDQLGIF